MWKVFKYNIKRYFRVVLHCDFIQVPDDSSPAVVNSTKSPINAYSKYTLRMKVCTGNLGEILQLIRSYIIISTCDYTITITPGLSAGCV